MTVQFILGRSGSGKTYHCLESLRERLTREPQGPPLLLLVPEQATFQMEQALVAQGLAGYHRAVVVSFARLARQILQDTAAPHRPVLSEAARQMILGRLIQESQSELIVFGRQTNCSGFVAQLSAMIRQLHQYQKTPALLYAQRDKLYRDPDPASKLLADKLADLALIYQAYQHYIAERFVDPDDFLDLMSRHCPQAELLRDAHLWIDGFSGFTPQQYTALEAITAQVVQSHISLCVDPDSRQFQQMTWQRGLANHLDETDLFHPTLQTYQRLRGIFTAAGMELRPPLILPSRKSAQMPRFEHDGQLAQLERNFFREDSPSFKSTQSVSADTEAATTAKDEPVQDIMLVEASSRRSEVDAAARQILYLCRQKNYQFRDIAVILRDFDDYQELIEASFIDHGIAYFIDQRRSMRHHPLVEMLCSTLAVVSSDFRSEHVFSYLKTDLPPLPHSVIDALENYVLAHGIESGQWYEEAPWRSRPTRHHTGRSDRAEGAETGDASSGEEINQYRLEAIGPLRRLRESLYAGPHDRERQLSVRLITAALVGLIEEIGVRNTLSAWCRQARADDDLDTARMHEQVYREIVALLDDLVEALGDVSVTLEQYAQILSAALAQMTLALIPPALDQVLVGSIERSRHPRVRAAMVLGLNEGRFPRVASADSFFSDDQRKRLLADDFELAPTSSQQLLHERYLAYIALTRPQDILWASYPVADDRGNTLNPSSIIENIRWAVDDISLVRLADDHACADADRITNLPQLAQELALAFSPHNSPPDDQLLWQQLYQYAHLWPNGTGAISNTLAGVNYRNKAELSREAVAQLFPDASLASSVSRLESFAACPFQHFSRYLLALEERAELKLGPPDMGSFYHAALCHIFQRLHQKRLSWQQVSLAEIEQIVADVTTELSNNDPQIAELLAQSHRNQYLLANARRRLEHFCRALQAAADAGHFQQQYAELKFGPHNEFPPLKLDLPHDRKLSLAGKIDRVDTCLTPQGRLGLTVIDYKSSATSFSFAQFYHGLSLQLLSYLLALQTNYQPDEQTLIEPAGALYWAIQPIGETKTSAPPPEVMDSHISRQDYKPNKATGLMSQSWLGNFDSNAGPGDNSSYFSFGFNKNGSIRYADKSPVVEPQEMSDILDYCRRLLGELAERILEGDIAVSPYRCGANEVPCEHCEFSSFCRFDPSVEPYRQLPLYEKQEVLDRINKILRNRNASHAESSGKP